MSRTERTQQTMEAREGKVAQSENLQDRDLSCAEDAAACATLMEELVRRYHHPLRAYATHLLGTDECAQDIVQDTWEAFYRQLRRQSPSWVTQAHLFAWLRTVVRNKALNYLKAQQRLRFLDAQDSALPSPSCELPESSAVRADICCALYQAIGSLRQPQRDVIIYRFFYGYSLPEIIRSLGLPLNTVKARLARGKKQLQHMLSECGVERSDLAALAPRHAPQGICVIAGW